MGQSFHDLHGLGCKGAAVMSQSCRQARKSLNNGGLLSDIKGRNGALLLNISPPWSIVGA
jgi:hypothetical protein